MSSITGTGASSAGRSPSSSTGGNDLSSVNMDEFLNLLIVELQNQDPMNPMDNAQMLQQISQIREIGSTNQLTTTLTNFSNSQELSMASGLIGRTVSALDSDAKEITGTVDKVAITTDSEDPNIRKVSVHIGSSTVDIKNIREIVES